MLGAALLGLAVSAAHAELGLQRVITLPGVRGQFGQLALDTTHQRLFVTVTGSSRLLAIDLKKNVISNQLTGLDTPSGVVYLPDGRVAVTGDSNGAISFYTAATLALSGSLIFGSEAGAACFDPVSNQIYLGYGREQHGGVAVIGADGKPLTQLPTTGYPRGLVVDSLARRLYLGFSASNAIAVFDLTDNKQIADWSLGAGDGATYPLILDGDGKYLFIGGRSGDEIAVLDTRSGKVLQTISAPGDVAAMSFDPQHRELYVPGGIGQLAIYTETAGGLLHEIGRIPTRHGARSGLLDADTGHYYLALPATRAEPAAIQVYLVIDRATDATQQNDD
jgi:DNA-binding beta-propeller fold protein YncE